MKPRSATQTTSRRAYTQGIAAAWKANLAERATWPKCVVPSCGTHVFELGAKTCRLHAPPPPPLRIEEFMRRPAAWMEGA